jgi:intracellular sulfur oxidation DsrE/DsrF family protein
MRIPTLLAISLAASFVATTASAQMATPRIAGYGAIAPLTGAEGRADRALRYRLVFSVTKAAPSPDKVNPSLEKVARLLNLLGRDNIKPKPGDLVVIVHGAATPIVANSAVYASKTKAAANPNLELIEKLRAAGVTVAVCSQALHGNKISPMQLAPSVRVDLSAMTTLAALQLRGWALMPD